MFKKNLTSILATFTKTRDDLELFVSDANTKVGDLSRQLEDTKSDRDSAEHTLAKVKEILGE
jgi:hypothetical protein